MRRTIIGASVDMVRKLAATVAADQPAAQQATTAANTATQAAQQAQQAATAAGQLAAQAVANNATLAETVAALNKLSQDYVTAVKASQDDRADLRRQLVALQARKVVLGRAANVVTPAVVLNGTADVTVALSRTMPGVDYDVEIAPALALLGKVTLTVKTRTTTAVVVTVKATVAITASSIDVTAYQLTPLTP